MLKNLIIIALVGILGFLLLSNNLNFFSTKKNQARNEEQRESPHPPSNFNYTFSMPNSPQDKKMQKILQDTFKLHQRFIEKCFIKHYERLSGNTKSGNVLARFTINKKGRLEKINIQESDFKDDLFHSCLREVISRVRIKLYKGKSMIVDFPIKVTLPN